MRSPTRCRTSHPSPSLSGYGRAGSTASNTGRSTTPAPAGPSSGSPRFGLVGFLLRRRVPAARAAAGEVRQLLLEHLAVLLHRAENIDHLEVRCDQQSEGLGQVLHLFGWIGADAPFSLVQEEVFEGLTRLHVLRDQHVAQACDADIGINHESSFSAQSRINDASVKAT